MSNFLTEAREDLASLLTGYAVFPFRPEGGTPPFIAVEAADPYLEPGQSWTDFKVHMSLTCVLDSAVNETATQDVDELILDVLEKVREDWTLENVTVGVLDLNGLTYPSAVINLSTNLF